MRKIIVYALLMLPCFVYAQIGIKAGLNFANVSNASSINNSSRSGFMFGLFLEPSTKRIISSKTEIIYSRQGYNFKNGTTTGNVNLDYIIIPQGMCINITRFVQLQIGAQIAFLLNAKADTTTSSGSSNPYSGIMSFYNKFDYGFGLGAEIHPIKGLLIGARYNISLANLYSSAQSGQMPTFSSADAKNNVVQIFAGWKFGGYKSKK